MSGSDLTCYGNFGIGDIGAPNTYNNPPYYPEFALSASQVLVLDVPMSDGNNIVVQWCAGMNGGSGSGPFVYSSTYGSTWIGIFVNGNYYLFNGGTATPVTTPPQYSGVSGAYAQYTGCPNVDYNGGTPNASTGPWPPASLSDVFVCTLSRTAGVINFSIQLNGGSVINLFSTGITDPNNNFPTGNATQFIMDQTTPEIDPSLLVPVTSGGYPTMDANAYFPTSAGSFTTTGIHFWTDLTLCTELST